MKTTPTANIPCDAGLLNLGRGNTILQGQSLTCHISDKRKDMSGHGISLHSLSLSLFSRLQVKIRRMEMEGPRAKRGSEQVGALSASRILATVRFYRSVGLLESS